MIVESASGNMPDFQWDIAVIGGGVAGSAAAAALAQSGFKVGLLEQGPGGKPRIGEVIPYWLLKWLRDHCDLDLFQSPEVRRWPVSFQVKWGIEPLDEETPQPSHLRIDRLELDQCLFRHALRKGATGLLGARLRRASWTDDQWQLQMQVGATQVSATARFAVEATGRSAFSPVSTDRGRLFDDLQIACSLRLPANNYFHDHVWIESHQHGWWYASELPEGDCLIVFFTDRDLMPAADRECREWLAGLWNETQASQQAMSDSLSVASNSVWARYDARMSLRRQGFGPGWMAVGDALMALDPLSGQGIAESIKSAHAAAQLLTAHDSFREIDWRGWAEGVARHYQQLRYQRLAQYARETAYQNSLYWQRRIDRSHHWRTSPQPALA